MLKTDRLPEFRGSLAFDQLDQEGVGYCQMDVVFDLPVSEEPILVLLICEFKDRKSTRLN